MLNENNDIAATIDNRGWSLFSLMSVVISNLLLMAIALMAGISITSIIWLYWCEGVIIGGFHCLKIFSIEHFSIEYLKKRHQMPGLEQSFSFAIFFLFFQVPIHALFASWIYFVDPEFDYAHALLVMGGVILAQKILVYFRYSPPWEEKGQMLRMIKRTFLFVVRFVPILALYHFVVTTESGKGNMVLLTVGFMLLKLVSDVIFHIFERN